MIAMASGVGTCSPSRMGTRGLGRCRAGTGRARRSCFDPEEVQQASGASVVLVLVEPQPSQLPLLSHRVPPVHQVPQGSEETVEVPDERPRNPVLIGLDAQTTTLPVVMDVGEGKHQGLVDRKSVV